MGLESVDNRGDGVCQRVNDEEVAVVDAVPLAPKVLPQAVAQQDMPILAATRIEEDVTIHAENIVAAEDDLVAADTASPSTENGLVDELSAEPGADVAGLHGNQVPAGAHPRTNSQLSVVGYTRPSVAPAPTATVTGPWFPPGHSASATPGGEASPGQVPLAGPQELSQEDRNKQNDSDHQPRPAKLGHLFFFILCDVRRATIGCNTVTLLVTVVLFFANISGSLVEEGNIMVFLEDNRPFRAAALFCVIFFNSMGVIGAVRFNLPYVMASALWHCISFLFSGLILDVIGMSLSLLSAYPNFVLAKEIQTAIMSCETYRPREEFSCCCL